MTKYLLDTDICIFFIRGKYKVREKVYNIESKNCFVSEITLAELKYGAAKSDDYEKHAAEARHIERIFTVVPIIEHLDEFAKEKARLQQSGTIIPDFDLLIGTTAVSGDFTLVTNNEKHLSRIEGIQIENWRKAEFNEFITG